MRTTTVFALAAIALAGCNQAPAPQQNENQSTENAGAEAPVTPMSAADADNVTYRVVYPGNEGYVATYDGKGVIQSRGDDGKRYTGAYRFADDGKLCVDFENDRYDDCYRAPSLAEGETGTAYGDSGEKIELTRLSNSEAVT